MITLTASSTVIETMQLGADPEPPQTREAVQDSHNHSLKSASGAIIADVAIFPTGAEPATIKRLTGLKI